MAIRKTIFFTSDTEWVYRSIMKLVNTKKEMGLPSTFSSELIRLAKNNLGTTLNGTKLDREILADR